MEAIHVKSMCNPSDGKQHTVFKVGEFKSQQ